MTADHPDGCRPIAAQFAGHTNARQRSTPASARPRGVILIPEKRFPPQGKRQGEGSVLWLR